MKLPIVKIIKVELFLILLLCGGVMMTFLSVVAPHALRVMGVYALVYAFVYDGKENHPLKGRRCWPRLSRRKEGAA